jgi:hypothetical protein
VRDLRRIIFTHQDLDHVGSGAARRGVARRSTGRSDRRSGRPWRGAKRRGGDPRGVLSGNLEIVRDLGDRLAGKVVVDISNPLNETFDGLATAPGTSAAEEVAQSAPADARVVKAFNTTFSGTLVGGQVAGQPLDVFIAGDDEAREKVAQLVRDGGCGRSTWVLWSALGSLRV